MNNVPRWRHPCEIWWSCVFSFYFTVNDINFPWLRIHLSDQCASLNSCMSQWGYRVTGFNHTMRILSAGYWYHLGYIYNVMLWSWFKQTCQFSCNNALGYMGTKLRIQRSQDFDSAHNSFSTLRPWQIGGHFPDDIFKCFFLFENVWIGIKISLKFVPKVRINKIPALVQIMAWCRIGDMPLSEPIMVNLLTHICVARPQWFKCTDCYLA